MTDAALRARSLKVTASAATWGQREVPVETPVALVYDGGTYAVMMASPTDLEDFAVGFSLSEGIVAAPNEISSLEVIEQPNGIELRMWLVEGRARDLAVRRRQITGPTGCGLCGVESLDAVATTPTPVTSDANFSPADVRAALASLAPAQALNQRTRAVHGAGYWTRKEGLVAIAEDVGRHNALDKLIGRLRRSNVDVGAGMIVLTSRVSVEMAQKAATVRAPVLVAVSAPTGLALKTAEAAGITLVAVARDDGFEVFTHPHRIRDAGDPDSQSLGSKSKERADHAA